MSAQFINYNGETLALLLALPNWAAPMKLEATLPTDVSRSLLATETRRAFANSQRYSLDFLFDSLDAADSTDLRLWLLRLKTELVAVPLWTDQCELSASCNAGARTLQKTSTMPARYGVEWLLMSEDGADFEIVTITSVGSTTMAVDAPGTNAAWPVGTMIFPLLFGRLNERPEFEGLTDEVMSGRIIVKENSAYARRLNPRSMPANLMGSHVPDFSLFKLWTVQPNWSRPLDSTEADILYQQRGFGRVEQQYEYQNWNRRAMEMEFEAHDRDEMAAIEFFFNERKGTTLPFFIPTFRGDLRLAADIDAGAGTFQIEESRYEQASYDVHPAAAFLALCDQSGVYPQRITEVNLTTVTPQVAIGEAHAAIDTKVSYLVLVRFAESKLTWENQSDGIAVTRLRFIEVPDEYVTAAPAVSPPAFLYEFSETLPNGTTNFWRYTSHEDSKIYGGQTFTPAPFSHGRYKAARDLSDPFDLQSWGGDFVGNPLGHFLPYILNGPLRLTLTRVNADNPGDGLARILYFGDMVGLDTTGTDWKASFSPFGKLLERQFPRFLLQTPDNFTQFETATQLLPGPFQVNGTIGLLAVFTVNVLGPTNPLDWFSGGWLTTGAGANFEQRSILKSTVSGTIQTLTLDRPLVHAVLGQACAVFPGYDGSRAQCDTKFGNNENFGGFPFMPDTNPSIMANEVMTPSGGKK